MKHLVSSHSQRKTRPPLASTASVALHWTSGSSDHLAQIYVVLCQATLFCIQSSLSGKVRLTQPNSTPVNMSLFNASSQTRSRAGQSGAADNDMTDATKALLETSGGAHVEAQSVEGAADAIVAKKDGFSLKNQLSSVLDNK